MAFSARIVATLTKQLPKHANKVPSRCLMTSYIGSRKSSTTQYVRAAGGGAVPSQMIPFISGVSKRCFCSSSDCNQTTDTERIKLLESTVKQQEEEISQLREEISGLQFQLAQLALRNQANDLQFRILKIVFPNRDPPIKHIRSLVDNPHSIDMTKEEKETWVDLVAHLSQKGIDIKMVSESTEAQIDIGKGIQSRILNSFNEETGSTT